MNTSALYAALMQKSASNVGVTAALLAPLLVGGAAGGAGGYYLTRKSKSKLSKIIGPVLGALSGVYAGMVGSTALGQYMQNRVIKSVGSALDTPQWLKNKRKNTSMFNREPVSSKLVDANTGDPVALPEDYLSHRKRSNTTEYNNWMSMFGPKTREKFEIPEEDTYLDPLFFDALAGIKLDKIKKIPAVKQRIAEEDAKAKAIEEALDEVKGMSDAEAEKYKYPFGRDKSTGRQPMLQPPVTARQAIDAKILRDFLVR